MSLPLKNGHIDWHEWHSQIARESLTIALGAREAARQCRPDKYLSDSGWVAYYRRKALSYIRVANRHAKEARRHAASA